MHPYRRITAVLLATILLATVVTAAVPGGRADAYTTVVYNGAGSAPRIGIIGDSTIAALRWTNTFAPLRRFNFVYDAESCRRTAIASCRGREGYQPENVITTMRRLSGQWGSVLVIMGGYDDPGYGFASAVDAVMTEASRQGIPTVMWLTMRTADVSYVGPTFASNTFTFRDNNRILLQKAQQYGDRLQIADWATYSATRSSWFYADGIHMTPAGASAAASYIASSAAAVLSGQTITPLPGSGSPSPWVPVRRFDRGSSVAAVQRALISAGYGFFGGASGVFGRMTEAAVRRFQQAYGLPVTGIVDVNTAERLGLVNYSGIVRPPNWRVLRRGMAGTVIVAAQQILNRRGFTVRGGATGVFDVHLYNAVVAFQRKHGLRVTGVIDEATARKIGLYSGTWTDLRFSFSGSRVTAAQRALIAAGVPLPGGATGVYNAATRSAVASYQVGQGLPVTGIIDAATAARLGIHVAPERSSVWTNLTGQSRGPAVANAQRAMMARGIYVRGGATGIFDGWTKNAVINFQRRNGLPVTGVIDHGTARRLGLFDVSDVQTNWRDLRLFTVGPLVASAERGLIAAGYAVNGAANNVFDKYTYYAVRRFQAARGLPVTGVINLTTARALGMFGAPATAQVSVLSVAAAPAPSTTSITSITAPATTSTTTTTTTTTSAPTSDQAVTTEPVESDTATIGDLVWLDVNGDGLQDEGEPGVAGVVVRLLDGAGKQVAENFTDPYGNYEFAAVPAGTYVLEVALPEFQLPTVADRGEDDERDSDVTQIDHQRRTGRTDPFDVVVDSESIDVGLVADPGDGGQRDTSTTVPAPSTTVPSESTTTGPTSTDTSTSAPETTSTEPPTTATEPPVEETSTTAVTTTAAPSTSVAP
jgi:peptidoglycan hydrolase-like protein with peptidoglycan-binding domain